MQLTERDFEIVAFVLNMKFASVADIHRKFFRKRKDGRISDNEWYVRERLRELTKEGYLEPVRYRFENKIYYIGTKHGYDLILHSQAFLRAAKPIGRIDVRTFDHDIQVMKSRLLIEESEKVCDWQSDRQLKSDYAVYCRGRGGRDSTPDGVYISLTGKRIAFEFEIAQKSRQRYQNKILRYVSSIRKKESEAGLKYNHVRIICAKESVFNILSGMTKIYGGLFSIERADSFFEKNQILEEVNQPSTKKLFLM